MRVFCRIVVALLLLTIGLVEFVGAAGSDLPAPPEPARVTIETEHSPTLGPADAPVTVVEFADFQCPACRYASTVMIRVVASSSGHVRWVFKHYPLPGHGDAPLAHEAAVAAGEQGKFWDMHHRLFRFQSQLTRQDLINHAGRLGLDVPAFTKALDSRRGRRPVQRDVLLGKTLKVRMTPTYFINGLRVEGSGTFDQFKMLIDAEVARAAASKEVTTR